MNKKDLKILNILKKNVRQPYSKIAKELGMTENAIKYRIKKMEKEEIIKGYFMDLASKAFGKNMRVMLMINVSPSEVLSSIKKLLSYQEISKVYRCAGQYSLLCSGFFKGKEDFVKFMDTKLLAELPVTNWTEYIILQPYKETFFHPEPI